MGRHLLQAGVVPLLFKDNIMATLKADNASLSLKKKLYPIDECRDLMVDACLWESMFNLMFISIWGRDTAIQSFLARLTLGRSADGLEQFHIVNEQNPDIPIFINSVDRLEKRLARVYRQTIFGSLTNLWLFDSRCLKPDKSNSSAILLLPKEVANPTERIWSTVKETCPLPLLDHWQQPVLAVLKEHSMLTELPKGIGNIAGYQINLHIPDLKLHLGEKIRQGILTTTSQLLATQSKAA